MSSSIVPAVDPPAPLCAASEFRSAMQRMAGSVCIVTTKYSGRRLGLTATAVCSLSADPPSLVVCVNRSAEAHDSIVGSRCLAVNVLGTDHVPLSVRFSAGDGSRGPARFDSAQWGARLTGAPILDDAVAWFDCRVAECLQASTHTVFICHVAAAGTGSSTMPLIYSNRQYGRTAPHE